MILLIEEKTKDGAFSQIFTPLEKKSLDWMWIKWEQERHQKIKISTGKEKLFRD